MRPDLLLSDEELQRLTGYKRPGAQLAELHRRGFHRARRNVLGAVVLERAHYEAVSAGADRQEAPTPQLRPPRLRTV